MKELDKKAIKDNQIMKIMKVSEISHILADTNRGTLTLKLIFGGKGQDYRLFLDAVPFNDEENKELLSLLNGVICTVSTVEKK